jgi:hypothetical protein
VRQEPPSDADGEPGWDGELANMRHLVSEAGARSNLVRVLNPVRELRQALGEDDTSCHDAAMVEYGNGVGQVAGGSGGRVGSGGGDVGAQFVNFVTDSVHRISTLPPETLLLIVVIAIVGLFVLKRAF